MFLENARCFYWDFNYIAQNMDQSEAPLMLFILTSKLIIQCFAALEPLADLSIELRRPTVQSLQVCKISLTPSV